MQAWLIPKAPLLGPTHLSGTLDRNWILTRTRSPAEIIREWYSERAVVDKPSTKKDAVREAHFAYRRDTLQRATPFLREHGRELLGWFAGGSEIRPAEIQPELVPVRDESEEARLFRLAALWWSVPVSQGFGRRQRFLVVDKSNARLIGIFALGDP